VNCRGEESKKCQFSVSTTSEVVDHTARRERDSLEKARSDTVVRKAHEVTSTVAHMLVLIIWIII
jgi:hypothetical protein